MNTFSRTILASIALCAVAFAQSAAAQEQVKSDVITKSSPQPIVVKPVNTNVPPGYNNELPVPGKPKMPNKPSANGKSKLCMMPNGAMVVCK